MALWVFLIGFYAFWIGVWSGEFIYGYLPLDAEKLTALFTGGQVVVAIGQVVLFLRQFRYMEDSVVAARDAAKAADISAKTAQDSFSKLERPYLFVYGVTTIMWDERLGPFVKFDVANHGKTPAIIEAAKIGISTSFNAPSAPLLVPHEHVLLTSPVLGSGDSVEGITEPFPLNIGAIRTGNDQMLVPDIGEDEELFLVVSIQYRGAFTNGHVTTACWRYDVPSCHFTQLGLSECNFLR